MRCPECNGRGETIYYVETHRDEYSVTVEQRKGVCRTCNGSGEKPMTNADHFREAISTEEGLAKFLMRVHDEGIYVPFCQNKKECWDMIADIPGEKCLECMKEWMRKIYEEDKP